MGRHICSALNILHTEKVSKTLEPSWEDISKRNIKVMMLDTIVILFIVVKKGDRFPGVFIMNMECYCYGYILKDMGSI